MLFWSNPARWWLGMPLQGHDGPTMIVSISSHPRHTNNGSLRACKVRSSRKRWASGLLNTQALAKTSGSPLLSPAMAQDIEFNKNEDQNKQKLADLNGR